MIRDHAKIVPRRKIVAPVGRNPLVVTTTESAAIDGAQEADDDASYDQQALREMLLARIVDIPDDDDSNGMVPAHPGSAIGFASR